MPKSTHGPLSNQQVKALRPGPRPIDLRDGFARGLILTILPSGRKQFTVRYVFQGKHRRLVLGDYPDVSLADARDKAEDARTAIRDGRDPAGERQAAKAERTDTMAALVTAYLDEHARPNKRSAAEDARILKADVLPTWGDRSVRAITRRDVKALLVPIVKRGAPIMANRTLALVRKVLNYAVDEEWIDANPAARVKKPAPDVERDRVLTDDELRRLWRCLEHVPTTAERPAPGRKRAQGDERDPLCPISPALAAVLKVRLLTAQRGGEVARMRWQDLQTDSGWWTIPAEHAKNKQAHRVFLTADVVTLIRAQEPEPDEDEPRGEYVFVGRGGAQILDRAKKAPAIIAKLLKFDFRGHDLRRTAATRMAEAGIPREHISHVLNHVQGGARATRIYDRHTYDREKRVALETWNRVLTSILDTPDGKVLPFARG